MKTFHYSIIVVEKVEDLDLIRSRQQSLEMGFKEISMSMMILTDCLNPLERMMRCMLLCSGVVRVIWMNWFDKLEKDKEGNEGRERNGDKRKRKGKRKLNRSREGEGDLGKMGNHLEHRRVHHRHLRREGDHLGET